MIIMMMYVYDYDDNDDVVYVYYCIWKMIYVVYTL